MAQSDQPDQSVSGIAPPSDDSPIDQTGQDTGLSDQDGDVAGAIGSTDPSPEAPTVVTFLDASAVTPVQLTIATAVIVVSALVLLPIRSIVVSYFAAKRADPGAASRAGWSLYWLMFMVIIVLPADYLFSLLVLPLFHVSAGIVVVIFLTILVLSFMAAQRSVR